MKVSVITVCYNAANEIARTIHSVLEQTFDDMEYIIIDGASTDSTIKVINDALNDISNRKTYVVSEPDKGIYDAMNKGIRVAHGEWLCMMNAGDMFTNSHVLEDVFSSSIVSDVSFIYSDFYKATSFGRYFRVHTFCKEHNRLLVHQSIIYKKCLHERFGYYIVTPKIIISDYLFFLQVPVNETMKVDIVIAKYEGGGISEIGGWCKQQSLCADVVYRHGNFWLVQLNYLKWCIKTCLPKKIREWLRLRMSGVENV